MLYTKNIMATRYQRPGHSGQRDRRQGGFTIIETMIVLAVSGLLFASLVTLTSGRRQQTEFQQSVNNVVTQLQQVISDVQNGYYGISDTPNCTAPGGGGTNPLSISAGTSTLGTNSQCVFLGKVLQFKDDADTFRVHVVAGDRTAVDFMDSHPTILYQGTSSDTALANGMHVTSAKYGTSGTPIGAVAIVTSLEADTTPGSTGTAGSQTTQIIPLAGTNITDALSTPPITTSTILGDYPLRNPPGGVQLCLSDGSGHSGLVFLGAPTTAGGTPGASNSVRVKIKNNNTCS
jgi:prepilin-type N-terminal cleavage/methylation domain-containing protein